MNQVNLAGHITYDLELKKSKQDIYYTQFRLAVDERGIKQKRTHFIDLVAFGKQAEILSQYISKGDKLFISGRLASNAYTHTDGNKVTKIKVIVEEFEFAGYPKTKGSKEACVAQNV